MHAEVLANPIGEAASPRRRRLLRRLRILLHHESEQRTAVRRPFQLEPLAGQVVQVKVRILAERRIARPQVEHDERERAQQEETGGDCASAVRGFRALPCISRQQTNTAATVRPLKRPNDTKGLVSTAPVRNRRSRTARCQIRDMSCRERRSSRVASAEQQHVLQRNRTPIIGVGEEEDRVGGQKQSPRGGGKGRARASGSPD